MSNSSKQAVASRAISCKQQEVIALEKIEESMTRIRCRTTSIASKCIGIACFLSYSNMNNQLAIADCSNRDRWLLSYHQDKEVKCGY